MAMLFNVVHTHIRDVRKSKEKKIHLINMLIHIKIFVYADGFLTCCLVLVRSLHAFFYCKTTHKSNYYNCKLRTFFHFVNYSLILVMFTKTAKSHMMMKIPFNLHIDVLSLFTCFSYRMIYILIRKK